MNEIIFEIREEETEGSFVARALGYSIVTQADTKVSGMSTKAQAILDEIRALPPTEFQAVWQEIQAWLKAAPPTAAGDDPIRSARGMFAGSHLTEALLASRAEERRRG